MPAEKGGQGIGVRGRLGELCHRSGMLRLLQQLRRWRRKDLRILAYHRVLTLAESPRFDFDLDLVSASAEDFREQMLLLKKHFSPISLTAAGTAIQAGQPLPPDAVVVTFDDGYDDNYRVAYPILRELGVPATFFVSTGYIDSGLPYDYDWLVHMILMAPMERVAIPELALELPQGATHEARRQLAGMALSRIKMLDGLAQTALIERLERDWRMPRDAGHPDCRPMSWEQVREMHVAGFEIGSHGVHHRMLAKLSQEELEFELCESKVSLERQLGTSAMTISYPVGGESAFDERVINATITAGYQVGCSYICGTNRLASPRLHALYRLPVERVMGLGWFDAMLTLPEWVSYPTSRSSTKIAQTECSS
jgi:peptidoglycan/xylan/chitin deacetylase (PgdA/CDA1 family)